MKTEADPKGQSGPALVRVLATTDLHGALLSHDYYAGRPDPAVGLSRVATLVAAARAEAAERGGCSILLDNGDGLQGAPLGEVRPGSRGVHPLMKAFRALRYDATGLGNHDFNYGLSALARTLADAPGPVVCSNMAPCEPEAKLPFQAEAVLERKLPGWPDAPPLRIGILSVLPPQTVVWDAHLLEGRVTVADMVPAAAAAAARLRDQGCDVVIALAHTGIGGRQAEPGMENALAPLADIEGIDALVGGHTHLLLPSPEHQFPKPVVMPGSHGSHLGVIDLFAEYTGQGWRISGWDCGLRPVARRGADGEAVPLAEECPQYLAAMAEDHADTVARMEQPVGTTATALHSYFTHFAPDRALALAAAAQAAAVRAMTAGSAAAELPLLSAAAPGKSGGRSGPRHFTDIAEGQLRVRNVGDLQIFPNELRAIVIDGAGLRDWLEMSAGLFNQVLPGSSGTELVDPARAGHNFDVIFGLQYSIDISVPPRFDAAGRLQNPQAQRIGNLRWNGRPLDPAQKFLVAVNNYRVSGGGHFSTVRDAEVLPLPPTRIRDCIRDYLTGKLPPDPLGRAADPWHLAPQPGSFATVRTGPGARAYLDELPAGQVAAGEVRADGFLPLTLKL